LAQNVMHRFPENPAHRKHTWGTVFGQYSGNGVFGEIVFDKNATTPRRTIA